MEGALLYSQPRALSSLPHTVSSSRGCLLTPWVSLWTFSCAAPAFEVNKTEFSMPFFQRIQALWEMGPCMLLPYPPKTSISGNLRYVPFSSPFSS